MKNFLFISKKYSTQNRGAYCSSIFFQTQYNNIKSINCSKIIDYFSLNNENKLIFLTQNPGLYTKKLTYITANKLDCVVFIRPEFISNFKNIATNCFNLYKEHKKYDFYIPIIWSDKKEIKKQDKLILGIYFRNSIIVEDSYLFLKKYLNELNIDFELYILGSSKIVTHLYNKKIKKITITKNPEEFFSNITHYIYPESTMIDPFPQSILEAVHHNCQIIIPENKNKKNKDGIDDIKSCIKYHKEFSITKFYDNSDCILSFTNLKNFYFKLFENNFEYRMNRDKYLNITDFIIDNI